MELSNLIRQQCIDLRTLYAEDVRNKSLRLIIYGAKGSGKTTTACTGRKPIYVDSFDPGGLTVKRIQEDISSGNIIPNTSWEKMSLQSDVSTITKWLDAMKSREAGGLFNNIGTYILDGGSLFAEFLMRSVIALDTRNKTAASAAPVAQLQNYYPFQQRIVNIMKGFSHLPCDVIVTFHSCKSFDEVSGIRHTTLSIPGEKAPEIVLSVFGEVWMTIQEKEKIGLLTRRDGNFQAVTRIGDGVFDKIEPPNIVNMLKKCGWDVSPKPSIV